jgi:hypothetical protein
MGQINNAFDGIFMRLRGDLYGKKYAVSAQGHELIQRKWWHLSDPWVRLPGYGTLIIAGLSEAFREEQKFFTAISQVFVKTGHFFIIQAHHDVNL